MGSTLLSAPPATQAARDAEAAAFASIDALPVPGFIAMGDGRTLFLNRRWRDYIGPDCVAGQGWIAALHPSDLDATLAAWAAAQASNETFVAEHRLLGQDGAYRWFLTRAAPYPGDEGKAARWIATATDISRIVWAREVAEHRAADLTKRTAEQAAALTEAATELHAETQRREGVQTALLHAQKLTTLGQLTACVSHDFNNVLSVIQGSFDLIQHRAQDARVQEVAARGIGATQRATKLVQNLLTFGRQDAPRPVVLDIGAMLQETPPLIGNAIGRQLTLATDVQPGLWPVLADQTDLDMAIINLVVNARDATPPGGRITLGAHNVPAADRPAGLEARDYVAITVSDTGAGMNPDVMARAREPYFTTKPQGKGTGLGLSMVHAFAAQAGGSLTIDSTPGVGTQVGILLPRAGLTGVDDGADAPEAGSGATVLLVDDDAQVRRTAARFLRRHGHTVVEAASAESALVLIHTIPRLDLLVTDVTMQGAPGPTLAQRLRRERPNLPVLFITGSPDAPALAGEHVLGKPFTGAALEDAVLRRLGRKPDSLATQEVQLLAKLHNPVLLLAYQSWRAAVVDNALPRPVDLDAMPDAVRDHAFTVAADADGGISQVERLGRSLAARFGGRLQDTVVSAEDEVLGQLDGGYRRCSRTRSPTYEYASYDAGDGAAERFERLLLPLSSDGAEVTHLMVVVPHIAADPGD